MRTDFPGCFRYMVDSVKHYVAADDNRKDLWPQTIGEMKQMMLKEFPDTYLQLGDNEEYHELDDTRSVKDVKQGSGYNGIARQVYSTVQGGRVRLWAVGGVPWLLTETPVQNGTLEELEDAPTSLFFKTRDCNGHFYIWSNTPITVILPDGREVTVPFSPTTSGAELLSAVSRKVRCNMASLVLLKPATMNSEMKVVSLGLLLKNQDIYPGARLEAAKRAAPHAKGGLPAWKPGFLTIVPWKGKPIILGVHSQQTVGDVRNLIEQTLSVRENLNLAFEGTRLTSKDTTLDEYEIPMESDRTATLPVLECFNARNSGYEWAHRNPAGAAARSAESAPSTKMVQFDILLPDWTNHNMKVDENDGIGSVKKMLLLYLSNEARKSVLHELNTIDPKDLEAIEAGFSRAEKCLKTLNCEHLLSGQSLEEGNGSNGFKRRRFDDSECL